MKKVYLVRESGERLGPFERDEIGIVNIPYHDTRSSFDLAQLNILGFRIEEIPEQKVTITREGFNSILGKYHIEAGVSSMWFDLVKAASK